MMETAASGKLWRSNFRPPAAHAATLSVRRRAYLRQLHTHVSAAVSISTRVSPSPFGCAKNLLKRGAVTAGNLALALGPWEQEW